MSRKWDALTFSERKFYQEMVLKVVSLLEEDDYSSICSEGNERVYILDSEDDAFRVCCQVKLYTEISLRILCYNI